MLFEAATRLTGGVAILDLTGRVTAGEEADSLRNHMMEAFHHASRFVVLNCEHLSYCDSTAMGELVFAYSSIVRRGGMVKLLRPQRRLLQLLQMTHLDKVFEILDDEAAAVAGFDAASVAKSQRTLSEFLKDG